MEIGFAEASLLFGLLLLVAASLSGVMHGTVLSISVLSVAAASSWRRQASSRSTCATRASSS